VNSKAFWLAVLERAVKTFANTLLVMWAGDAGLDIMHTNVTHALGLAGGAAALSVLMSVASAQVSVGGNGPSLTTETVQPPPK
jgi:hypothetical protein